MEEPRKGDRARIDKGCWLESTSGRRWQAGKTYTVTVDHARHVVWETVVTPCWAGSGGYWTWCARLDGWEIIK